MGMRNEQSIVCTYDDTSTGLDSYARELCKCWLHEDHVEGVTEGESIVARQRCRCCALQYAVAESLVMSPLSMQSRGGVIQDYNGEEAFW